MKQVGISYLNPLSYTGPKMNTVPIRMIYREPTVDDISFRIGTFVLLGSNPTSGVKGNMWFLSEFDATGQAIWLKLDTSQHNDTHLPWTVISASTLQMVVNNGYFANYSSALQMTLPVSSSVGDTIIVTNISNGFEIKLNAGQVIKVGLDSTTVGVAGQLDSTELGDSVTFTCSVANEEWWGTSLQGNLILS